MTKSSKVAVIACEVLEPEVRHFLAGSQHVAELVIMPLGLHENPPILQQELQVAIDRAEANAAVETIVLVFGLCGRGVENLRHARCPLVIARAHDCVTLFLGDKERYAQHQQDKPGTYWFIPGWIRGKRSPGPEREAYLREQYAKDYDEEDVDYLLDVDRATLAHHEEAAYVGLGLGDAAGEVDYTKTCAACQGWGFREVPGDPALLKALLEGDWDPERFLIVPPNHVIELTGDDDIIRATPPQTAAKSETSSAL